MNLALSLEESKRLYQKFIRTLIPNKLINAIGIKGNLYKNGKRKKTYYSSGKKGFIYIQRMVFNKKYYFDLFPLFLIPNSIIPTEDLLEQKYNKFIMPKRRGKTKIDDILDKEDIYNLDTFDILHTTLEYKIYRSKYLYSMVFKKNKKSRILNKRHIFIIYLN